MEPRGRWTVVAAGVGILAVLALLFMFMFHPYATTPADKVGIHYTGGPIEGAHFVKVVPPGSGFFWTGVFDNVYQYPTTQRSYIIARGENADVDGVVSVPSKDRVQVDYEVATYFKLNLSKILDFHKNIGLKYHAWEEEGWDKMLSESLRQQIVYAIQRESRKFDVADIYADSATLLQIQTAVGTALKENVNQVLGDDYFCGVEYSSVQPEVCPEFEFVIKSVGVPQSVKSAFESNRTSEIGIATKQNEVEQAKLEAEAIKARQQALESCGQTCVLYEAIKSGSIDFWVIPDGGNVDLTLPPKAQG